MIKTLPPLIIEPDNPARCAIIWLHGLGADAHDFESIVPLLPTQSHAIRMIFPNAPARPITINGGLIMRAWYDINEMTLRHADKQGIAESTQILHQLIDEQIKAGIAADNIVVAGFSQGGAIAIHGGLRYPHKLAGILALSCYVLTREKHAEQIHPVNQNTPIWMAHGTQDTMVPYQLGESSAEFLVNNGHSVTFMSYPMGHEVCLPEITALAGWLAETLR